MTLAAVADTHTAIWYLQADDRLSNSARTFMAAAAKARQKVGLSRISLAELVYLIERGRLPSSAYEGLIKALQDPKHILTEVPFTGSVLEFMRSVPRDQVPDMPDRIIAASALYFGVPIISRGRQIRSTLLQTIW